MKSTKEINEIINKDELTDLIQTKLISRLDPLHYPINLKFNSNTLNLFPIFSVFELIDSVTNEKLIFLGSGIIKNTNIEEAFFLKTVDSYSNKNEKSFYIFCPFCKWINFKNNILSFTDEAFHPGNYKFIGNNFSLVKEFLSKS